MAGRLHSVTVELTLQCNLRCAHCYNFERTSSLEQARLGRRRLAAQEVEGVLREAAVLGATMVSFTGGEPLVYPDLERVLRAARKAWFQVSLKSNGSYVDRAMAKMLARYHVAEVGVSLYGASAESYAKFTGNGKAFERVCEGVRNLVEFNIPCTVGAVIGEHNAHEAEAMQKLVARLGAKFRVLRTFHARHTQVAQGDPLGGGAAMAAWERLYQGPLQEFVNRVPKAKPQSFRCGCARKVVAVAANGDVYPCMSVPKVAGNIRRQSLADIWHHSKVFASIRSLKEEDYKSCGACSDRAYCARVVGDVYGASGTLTGKSEQLCKHAALLRRIKTGKHAALHLVA
jgi:radical SAM protein with 4Fe4S-binding SPASM domain